MVAGCKQKMAEGWKTFVLNVTFTCYGKQRRHFEFLATWRTRGVILYFLLFLNLTVNFAMVDGCKQTLWTACFHCHF